MTKWSTVTCSWFCLQSDLILSPVSLTTAICVIMWLWKNNLNSQNSQGLVPEMWPGETCREGCTGSPWIERRHYRAWAVGWAWAWAKHDCSSLWIPTKVLTCDDSVGLCVDFLQNLLTKTVTTLIILFPVRIWLT